jgi:phosphoribosyl-ATP pyrophosphohydrolase
MENKITPKKGQRWRCKKNYVMGDDSIAYTEGKIYLIEYVDRNNTMDIPDDEHSPHSIDYDDEFLSHFELVVFTEDEANMIDNWLKEHGDPKIERQVEEEAFEIMLERLEKLEKERKDLLNWLKSELEQETKIKPTKIISDYKVELLNKIIWKLQK